MVARLPTLTAAQMASVDRMMVEELGLDVLQLMELAGRAVAAFARERFLGGDPRGRRVLVLAGGGNNGGDGLVAARLLLAWGAQVAVVVSHAPTSLRAVAARQLHALEQLGVRAAPPAEDAGQAALPAADVVIDALLGFGLSGPPSGTAAALIRAANAHPAPILAVDLPSGLDATTGELFDPCVRATATLTLALPKTGLLALTARRVVGDLLVADIGVPPAVYARLGIPAAPLFAVRDTLPVNPRQPNANDKY